MEYRVYSLGENCLNVDFGNVISIEINRKVLALAEVCTHNKFSGFIEAVPAFASLAIFYDVREVRREYDNQMAFAAIEQWIKNLLLQPTPNQTLAESEAIKIPVCYDDEFAPDLRFVAAHNNLSEAEVIEIHTNREYTVFMLGFLPGFPYLGEIDRRIAAPRRSEPRLVVPAGSVGIANRQTGIYPFDSPGGWQIIGKTPIRLFDANAPKPTLFSPGDRVHFYRINRRDFDDYQSDCK